MNTPKNPLLTLLAAIVLALCVIAFLLGYLSVKGGKKPAAQAQGKESVAIGKRRNRT